jgi:hypothetical protein
VRNLGRRFISELAEAKPQKGDDRSLFGTHALDLFSQIKAVSSARVASKVPSK